MRPKPNKFPKIGSLLIFDMEGWNAHYGSDDKGVFIIKVLAADCEYRISGEVILSTDPTNRKGSTCEDYMPRFFKKINKKQCEIFKKALDTTPSVA